MLATVVRSVNWIGPILLVVAGALAATAAAREPITTRIPHQDGTGTSTVVELEHDVPGAHEFARATPGPVPRPGEVIVPTRTAAPAPTITPGHAD